MSLNLHCRIVQVSDTRFVAQYQGVKHHYTGWLWWRKRVATEFWESFTHFNIKGRTYITGYGYLPGAQEVKYFESLAEAEAFIEKQKNPVRSPYPLVVKDPA